MMSNVRYQSRLLTTTAVEVTASAVVFKLPNRAFALTCRCGVVLVNIAQTDPTGTTTSLPVLFESNGQTQAATTVGGAAITASDVSTGVYQFYFDKTNNILQVLGQI